MNNLKNQEPPTLKTSDDKLLQILQFATAAHVGQVRKNTNLPYITHPIAVANIIIEKYPENSPFYPVAYIPNFTFKATAVALLHDVAEDTKVSLSDILVELKRLNISRDDRESIIWNVELLTKNKSNFDIIDYLTNIRKSVVATAVKLADLEHNMSDLKPGNLLDKYRLCREYLEPRKLG